MRAHDASSSSATTSLLRWEASIAARDTRLSITATIWPQGVTCECWPSGALVKDGRGEAQGVSAAAARIEAIRPSMNSAKRVDIAALADGVRAGSRAALARAITLVESRQSDHQAAARDLVPALLRDACKAIRVGVTGSPGVGKSTTIDVLGMFLIERGHRAQCWRRSLLRMLWRLDPCRQDADGEVCRFRQCLSSPSSGTLGRAPAKTWCWRKL